jgi:hypothetical protein
MTELTPELRELLRKYLELKVRLSNPVQRAMLDAVPDKLMRDIVNDHRRGVSPPSSLASTPGAPPPPARLSGWSEPAPLGPPPGINYVDALCDAQAAKERAALIVDAAIDRARRGAIADTHRAPATQPTENTPLPSGHLPKQSTGSEP